MQNRIVLKIYGIVQGVFFREFVKVLADKLKIKGYVKNLPDKTVEVVAEGEDGDLRTLLKACHEGPKRAFVEKVDVYHEEASNEFTSFRICF
ncbi:acylphosphatase [Candidatus Woesearchaeota archaeon CG10_big_fil_rev_8_21_14_0_10_30_7]|nr:MAG: acylphosphatase [Candidatus Woesearchaeota archaeon CG10_big_fil_rev_8_21_14_0_10_30_7]